MKDTRAVIINFAYQSKRLLEMFYKYQVKTVDCNDTVSDWSVIIMSDYKPDIHEELYWVSKAGDSPRVRELLEAGADPDKYKDSSGDTPLNEAARNGHNEVVKTLIQVFTTSLRPSPAASCRAVAPNSSLYLLGSAPASSNSLTRAQSPLHWWVGHSSYSRADSR